MTTRHAAIRFYGNGTIKTACGVTTYEGSERVLLNTFAPHDVTCKKCQTTMVPSTCYHLYAMEAREVGHYSLAKHYATGYLTSQVKAISQAEERVLAAKEEHAKAKAFLLELLLTDPTTSYTTK